MSRHKMRKKWDEYELLYTRKATRCKQNIEKEEEEEWEKHWENKSDFLI